MTSIFYLGCLQTKLWTNLQTNLQTNILMNIWTTEPTNEHMNTRTKEHKSDPIMEVTPPPKCKILHYRTCWKSEPDIDAINLIFRWQIISHCQLGHYVSPQYSILETHWKYLLFRLNITNTNSHFIDIYFALIKG